MNPGAMPKVRHGESVLWRTRSEMRLWRSYVFPSTPESFRGFASDSRSASSLLSFHKRCCFPVERGVIHLARLQIEFIDHDLHERSGGDSEENSQQPEQRPSRQREE